MTSRDHILAHLYGFAHVSRGFTASEIAERLDISRTWVHRVLRSLEAEELVVSTNGRPARWGISCEGYAQCCGPWLGVSLAPCTPRPTKLGASDGRVGGSDGEE